MSQESIALLIKDLRNARRWLGPDWNKRIAAARQLGAIHATEAVGDLAAVIDEMKHVDLCQACVNALGQIGGQQAIQMLARVLDEPNQTALHPQCIVALQEIGDDAAVNALIAAWSNPDPSQQHAIAAALSQLGSERIFRPLLVASASATPNIAEQSGKMIRALPDSTTRLVAALGDKDPLCGRSAVRLLAQIGSAAVPDLINALSNVDENVGSLAADALIQIGAPAVAALVKTLTGTDAIASSAAGETLVSIGQPAARPLLELLPTQPPVADLLAQIKPEVKVVLDKTSTVDLALVKAVFELSDADLRASAGQALAQIGEPAVPYLVEALHGDDDGRAQAAAIALGRMGEPAVGELIKGLLSDNEETSRLAAGGLANAGELVVQALLDILGQPNENGRDRRRALEPLQKIEAPEAVMLRPFLAHWRKMETCPRVLTIDPTGQGDFTNLADAVAGVAPLSVICFVAGDHTCDTHLYIEKPLALLGAGVEQTRLLCNGPLVMLGEGPTLIRGLNIENTRQIGTNVVTIRTTEARVDSCRFAGGVAPRAGTNDMFGGNGLKLEGDTKCRVTKCGFDHNAVGAILIEDLAEPVLEGNSCQGEKYAIGYHGFGGGSAFRNLCSTNMGRGIVVGMEAEPILIENVCERNNIGIHYGERAAGVARCNQSRGNVAVGIAVSGKSHPLLESNHCSRNNDYGISVNDVAQPALKTNICQDNGGGILYYDSASGTAYANRCEANATHGIELDNNAAPELSENICQKNQRGGIVYIGSSGGVAKRNQCNDNGEFGIVISDQARPAVERNTCRGNDVGCLVFASSGAVVKRNNFLGNRQADFVDERN